MFADTSLHKKKKIATIGVAVIDSCGKLLQDFGTPIWSVGIVIIAEKLKIRQALEKAMKNEWSMVQVLSDETNVVGMIIKEV